TRIRGRWRPTRRGSPPTSTGRRYGGSTAPTATGTSPAPARRRRRSRRTEPTRGAGPRSTQRPGNRVIQPQDPPNFRESGRWRPKIRPLSPKLGGSWEGRPGPGGSPGPGGHVWPAGERRNQLGNEGTTPGKG